MFHNVWIDWIFNAYVSCAFISAFGSILYYQFWNRKEKIHLLHVLKFVFVPPLNLYHAGCFILGVLGWCIVGLVITCSFFNRK